MEKLSFFEKVKQTFSKAKISFRKTVQSAKRKPQALIVAAVIVGVFMTFATFALPAAVWVTQTSTNCPAQSAGSVLLSVGNYVYVLGATTGQSFWRFEPATGICNATPLADAPLSYPTWGASMEKIDDDTIYAYLGGSSRDMFMYKIAQNQWYTGPNTYADDTANSDLIPMFTTNQTSGTKVFGINNEVYYFGGSTLTKKYRPATNDWVDLTGLSIGDASSFTAIGDRIYATVSGVQFRSFDTLQSLPGTWTNEDNIPTSVSAGAAITAVGNQIYAFFGGNKTTFYRYDTTAASGSRWKTTAADNSTPLAQAPDLVYGGAALIYPGTGDYIYAFQGNNQKKFWRFDTVNNTWTSMATTPDPVGPGGSLTTDGTFIYATPGNGRHDIWRYSITNDRWNNTSDGPVMESTFFDIGVNFTLDLTTNPQKATGGITYIASGTSGGGELFVTSGIKSTSLLSGDILRLPLTGTNAYKFPLWNTPRAPVNFGEGTSLSYPGVSAEDPSGENMYLLGGATTATFFKFLLPYNTYIPWNRAKITIDGDPNVPLSQNLPLLTSSVQQSNGATMVEVDGKMYYLFGSSSRFYRFDPSTNEWKKLTDTPDTVSTGASMVKIDNNTIYVFAGANNTYIGESRADVWKYDIPNDTWLAYNIGKLNDGRTIEQNFGTAVQSYGNSMEVVDGKFYVLWGSTGGFYRYDPALNTWLMILSSSSIATGRGSSMEAVGTNIYYMTTQFGSTTLTRYNTLTNTTTNLASMAAGTPSESYAGSGNALVYPGSGDYLYAIKGYITGNNRTNRQFWRYSITGNTWVQMADTPQDMDGGTGLTILPSDPNNIYAIAGGRNKGIWRYNITGNSWSNTQTDGSTVMAQLPDEVLGGADIENDGTYLYVTQGGERYNFWRYNFATNSWSSMAEAPTEVGWTCGLNSGGNCTSDGGDLVFYDPTSGSPGSGDEEIWLTPGQGAFGPKTNSGTCFVSQTKSCGVLFRYKIATDEWPITEKPEPAPNSISSGASLTYPGSGNFIYAFKGNTSRDFWIYDFVNNRWHSMYESVLDTGENIAEPGEQFYPTGNYTLNVNQGAGNDMVEVNGKLYVAMGDSSISGGDAMFMSYDPITNTWTRLPDTPFNIFGSISHGLVKYDNNTIYLRQGAASGLTLAKYIIDADPGKAGDQGVWSVFNMGLRDDGVPLNQGDNLRTRSITYSGGKFYVLSDDSTTPFRSYDPATNEWTTLEWTPVSPNSTSDLIAVGSDEIYAILGSNNFYKYTISQNRWSVLTANSGSCSSGGGVGSSLVYHASSNYIYRIKGGSTTVVCRFNVATQTWDGTARAAAPGNIGGGGSSAIIGDNIYVTAGGGTTNFWRYNITNNRWNNTLDGDDPTNGGSTTLNDLTPSPTYGGSALTTDGTYIYATKGSKSNTFWRYDPAGTIGSRWIPMSVAPTKFNQSQSSTFSDGGELSFYDPTPGSPGSGDEEIWAVGATSYDGYNPGTAVDMNFGGALFRYKISTNTWPYLPGPQPADASSTTSSLAYSGNGTYTADDTTDILTDVSHGLGNKSKVTLSTTGTFPGNLGAGPYYVVNATVDTFQLALTPNGSAIDITSTGSGTQSYAASYIYGFFSASQFGRYDVTTNEWLYFNRPKYLGSAGEDMIQEYGFTQGLGNSVVTLNNKIYMVPGGSSERFFKYDPSTNVWTELDNLPGTTNTFTTGTTMLAMAPDLIYATNSSQFFRYNATENGWIQLTAPPASAGHGAALAYPGTGDYIYLLRGSTTTTVYKYCFQNTGSGCTVNTWGTLTATAPATIASGGSMVGVGGALYALRGNNTNTFYKFTITVPSTGEGTWSTIANMQIPSTTYTPDFTTDIFTSVGHGLYNGARITIATTGTVPGGLGAGTSYFVINKTTDTFQISTTQGGSAINFSSNGTGTQTYVTNYTAYAGASLTTDGTDIYATTGNGTSGVMKYTVGTNTWSVMPILPTGVLVSDTGGNTRGGITYVPGGPSGGAELYVSTGNDAYQTSANVSAMLYGMPFTGADANTWPMISAPADMPASITTGGALIHPGTGQRIYALQGGSTNFWSFNTETGVWNAFDPANPAATISGGASFTTDGVNRIYTARGGANPEVYAYCFTTGPNCATADVWSSLTNFRTTIGGTTDKGAVTYVSTGPSGGPELYLTTGDGQAKTVQSNSTTVPGRKLLFRYPFTGPNANTWPINNRTPLAQPDSNVAAGGSLVYSNGAFDGANGSIYALLGNATNAFRKYTITNSPNPGDGTWSAPTTSGFTGGVTVGGSLVSDGSGTTLYAMNGGATTTLQKYTITGAATGTWATLTAAPVNHGQNNGGEIVYYDGKLWMTTGKGTSEMEDTYSLNYNGLMYIYDITGNTWPFYYQAADLPTSTNTFARGSDLASIGNGLTIYALRGSPGSTPTIANPNFWRYTISGSGVGSWSTMTNMPNNTNMVTVDAGGALASIGNNNIIYATRGGNNTDFYRFDSTAGAGNEWSIQSATPVGMGSTSSSSETGDITWNGIWGNIYMTPGNDTTTSPYNLYSFPINRLVITSVTKTGGGTPIVGQSMDVTIQAVDYANNPINVSNNVDVTLSLYTGGGSIGGTTTGTITSGNNSTVITGTTYNMPEGGVVFSAADTTFPANPTIYATSNSDPFTVDGATPDITSLSVVDGPTAGNTGVTINGTDFFGHYKRTITINNPNATTYTDHPVRLIINTLDPIAEGKMRSDCGDLRFTPVSAGSTNYGSLTQLSYWIESGCNSLYTYVWVKIPTLTASTTTDIDMFYGDTRLTSASSGDNTFIFFDDFTGTVLNTSKWTEVDSGSNVTINNKLYLSSGASNQGIYSIADGTDGNNDGDSNFNRTNNLILEFDYKTTTTSSNTLMGWKDTTNTLGGTSTVVGSGGFIHGINYNSTSTATNDVIENGASTNSTNSQRWFSNRDYKIRIIMRNAGSGNGAIYQRSWDNGKTWVNWLTNTTRTDASARIGFSNSFSIGEIDNVKVLTYATTDITSTVSKESTNLTVNFDGNAAYIASITPTQIQVITPPGAAGAKDVQVTNGDAQTTTEIGAFTYQTPTITNINPDSGEPTGGLAVTISGANFAPDYYRRSITIDNSSGGALTDYQIPITFDSTTLIADGKMHPEGNDIRFYDSDGTTPITNYWIEGPMNSSSTKVWVKVPSVSAASAKIIYLEYGDPTVPAQSSIANTFIREIDSYSLGASYPLNETSGNVTDFSGNNNTGSNTNTTSVAGKFNNARSFNGSNTLISAGNNSATQLLSGFTIETWVNLTTTTNNIAHYLISKSNDSGTVPNSFTSGYNLFIGAPNNTTSSVCGRSGNIANIPVLSMGDQNGTALCVAPTTALSPATGAWYHIVATFDPSTITGRVYVNGTQTGINSALPTEAVAEITSQSLTFGRASGASSNYLTGLLDDIRIYNRALSAAEISDLYGTAPHNNQGYTTTEYPGRVLVRQFHSTEPGITLGSEAPSISVTFDGTPATITSANNTSIEVLTPAHAIGTVPVVVTNSDSQTASTSFTYAILIADKTNTTVIADPTSGLEADGIDESIVTATLLTAGGSPSPVPNQVVTLAQLTGPVGGSVITAIDCPNPEPAGSLPGTSNVNGKACFNVKTQTPGASDYDGVYTFEATDSTDSIVFDDVADHPSITFIPEVTHKANSTVTAPGGSVVADGVANKTITVTLKNRNNVIIPNRTVRLNQISGTGTATITPTSSDTNSSGIRTFTVDTTTAGTYTFQAEDIENTPNVLLDDVADTITVVFVPGPTDPGVTHSTFVTDFATLPANGTEATLTATIKDQFDNIITGNTVSITKFSGPNAETITAIDCPSPEPAGISPGVSNSNGKACATISATQSGTYVIQATDTTSDPDVTLTQTVTINFTPATAADSTLIAVPTSVVATGTDYSLITATLRDASNNVFPNQSITLTKISGTGSPTIDAVNCTSLTTLRTGSTSTTNSSGKVCYKVTSSNLGTFQFEATNNTENFDITQTATVSFIEGSIWDASGKELAYAVQDDSTYQSRYLPKIIKTSDNNFVGISDIELQPSYDGAIYIQKFDANGNYMWPGNSPNDTGILLDSGSGELNNGQFELLADSTGGVIVVWEKDTTIYGQHLDSNGDYLWGATPKTLATNSRAANLTDCGGSSVHGICSTIPLISDGANGIFIAYWDLGVTVGGRFRISRYDSNGDMVTGEGWPQPAVGGADQTSANVCVVSPINLTLIRPGAVRVGYVRQVPDHSNNILCSSFVGDRYGERYRSINTSNPADFIYDGTLDTRSNYTEDPDLTVSYGSCSFVTPGNVDWIQQFEDGNGGVYAVVVNNCPLLSTQTGRLIVHYRNKDGILWNYELSPGGTSGYATTFEAIADGSGGIIILYNTEEGNDKLFLTRVRNSASDEPEEPWNGGTRIEVDINNPDYFHLVPGDTTGSAVVVYSDENDTYRVKKYDNTGNLAAGWPSTGVDIGTEYFAESYSNVSDNQGKSVAADGAGGIVVAGENYSTGWRNINYLQQFPTVIQRVSSGASILWNSGEPVDMHPGLDTINRPLKEQQNQQIVYVGNNQYIMAWEEEARSWFDSRSATHNIHADKFDVNGDHIWQVPQINETEGAGVQVGFDITPANTDNDQLDIAADELTSVPNGGFLTAWRAVDSSSTFIVADRFDSNGNSLWGNVMPIANGTNSQPDIISDGEQGAYLAWIKDADVYVAKLNPTTGANTWITQVTSTVGVTESNPRLVRFGASSLYVIYEQDNVGTAKDLVVRKLTPATGALGTTSVIDGSVGNQEIGDVIPYGSASGFIIAYTDDQVGPNNKQIKTKRIDTFLNNTVFPSTVSDATVNNINPRLATNSADGAYIVWERYNAGGTASNIAYTSLNHNNGGIYWDMQMLGDPNVSVLRQNPSIVPDGTDTPYDHAGFFVSWQQDDELNSSKHIYTSHVVNSIPQEGIPAGLQLSTVGTRTDVNPKIVTDLNNNAITTWEGNSSPSDVFGQRVYEADGSYNSTFTSSGSVEANPSLVAYLTVTLLDQNDNPVAGRTMQIDKIYGDPGAGTPTVTAISNATYCPGGTPGVTNSSGQACFTVSHNIAGVNVRYAATDITDPGNYLTLAPTVSQYFSFATPVLSLLTPDSGAQAGGETVEITGSGFYANTEFFVDGVEVTATYIDFNTVEITTPAHAAGAVDVTALNNNEIGSNILTFTYLVTVDITSITPSEATTGTLTTVTIYGTNIDPGTTVKLTKTGETDINCTNISVNLAETELTCDLDLTGAAIGLWDVVATDPGNSSSTLTEGFEVEGLVNAGTSTVTAVPTSVPANGVTADGSIITVTLRDGNNNPVDNDTVRLTSIAGSGTPGMVAIDCETEIILGNIPENEAVTGIDGRACFVITHEIRGVHTFQAEDITATVIVTQTVDVTFSCVVGINEQCAELTINGTAGSLTVTAPDDFTFPGNSSGGQSFSQDDPAYVLNTNDVVIVSDTRGGSGFNLQVQADVTGFNDGFGHYLPLQNLYVATKASSTGGTQINGVEYSGPDSSPQNIVALQDTTSLFTNPISFTSCGINLGTGGTLVSAGTPSPVDLMLGGLSGLDGRNGEFKQNVNYYLDVPIGAYTGTYSVTLTYTVTDDNGDPPATPPSCP